MWDDIKDWFKDSETIFIARLKVFLGAVVQVLTQTDFTQFGLSPHWVLALQIFSAYLIADGLGGEWARRRRATDLD